MKRLIKFFVKFYKDEEGIELVEWVLMAVLLALAVTAGIIVLGGNLNTAFSNIAECVSATAS
jgi:Flp pilus assembly pilin Flp